HARIERIADRRRGPFGFREGVGGEAIGQAVGLFDHFIEIAEAVITATGPNGSVFMIVASFGTSASTVGCQKKPSLPSRWPPAINRAPRFCASAMKESIASTRRGLAHGPIFESAMRPLPIF